MKYVVNRELAQKLQENGYPKDTTFYYQSPNEDEEHWTIVQRPMTFSEHNIPAPMADEIEEQLPLSTEDIGTTYYLNVWRDEEGTYTVSYMSADDPGNILDDNALYDSKSRVRALAKIWLWLRDNGYGLPGGINQSRPS